MEWLQKGTHEKHLSVLEFEKKERAKEVAELDSQKQEISSVVLQLGEVVSAKKQELQNVTIEKELAEEATQKANEERTIAQQEKEVLLADNQDLRMENSRLESRKDRLRMENHDLKQKQLQLQTDNEELEQRHEDLQYKNSELQNVNDQLFADNHILEQRSDALQSDNEEKYDESEQQIEKAKHEYGNAILQRLELRKEMVELYDKLRIKSDSARVMTTKNVENVRGEKERAIRILENEQRKYWHIIGQSDEKFGIGFIPLFREQYRDIANVKIEEAKQKLEEQQHVLENAFMVDFVAEINEAIREAKEEIDEINKALKDIPFGKDTYQFKMLEKPDRMVFFNLCKKLESYMNSMDVYRAMNQDDEEMEYNIRQFMDTILEEENEEEYTDYRKYFKYDMRILSRQDGEEVLADLSKKQGSASNGEKQTPYFIILAASLLQCYPKNVSCARLAFIDEAFSALSRERIEQMVKFFEDNKFQVIYAAPPEKIDSIGSHINSTISLCMKGKYTWAVEGLVKLDEFKTE